MIREERKLYCGQHAYLLKILQKNLQKTPPQKLLGLISDFSKQTEYRYKNQWYFYILAVNKGKLLGINLTKYMQNLYAEHYKTTMKLIK